MTKEIKQTLRDSRSARWTALVILSFTMFAGYMFTEVISPLKPILERNYGWDSADYGMVTSAYGIFNVFFFMLLIVGVLLDKFGIRFSTITSVLIMIIGGSIKYIAFKGGFSTTETISIFGLIELKEQVFFASLGYAMFGVGVEYAGITVSKSVVKWFKGREMALAMGMQVAIARLGSFVPLAFGAYIANKYGVAFWILMVVLTLIAGLAAFFYYNIMDRKLDKQLGELEDGNSDDEEFKISDLKVIFGNRGFWLIAVLCVLFYSAVFPFYKYGPDLMVNKFGVSESWAGLLPSLVPFGTMLLTPLFGGIYDKKGRGADIMILGAVLLIIVHVIFYVPFITSVVVAFFNVLILGVAFSLVPSAMWPSVPKIIPEKQLGSAYATIFWIQNFGLWGIPLLVGVVLNSTNPTIAPDKTIVQSSFKKAYTEVVVNSDKLMKATNEDGTLISLDDVDYYARNTASDVVRAVVASHPQEEVTIIDTATLRVQSYKFFKEILMKGLSDVSEGDLSIYEEKANVGFAAYNEKVVEASAIFISEKKVKLNYSYQTTWGIFVVLTIIALFIALWLKAEDKRKGYGLQLPNIQK
ncbi:MAG: MFS transporter [Bacteroidetes bacterium]|nr:MAG: MFS transporter [Bacteroidota bacterium]